MVPCPSITPVYIYWEQVLKSKRYCIGENTPKEPIDTWTWSRCSVPRSKLKPDAIMGILEKRVNVQVYLTLLHFTWLSFTDELFVLQIEGKTLHQQKDYNLLYCHTGFIVVMWNQTLNMSEIFLYIAYGKNVNCYDRGQTVAQQCFWRLLPLPGNLGRTL